MRAHPPPRTMLLMQLLPVPPLLMPPPRRCPVRPQVPDLPSTCRSPRPASCSHCRRPRLSRRLRPPRACCAPGQTAEIFHHNGALSLQALPAFLSPESPQPLLPCPAERPRRLLPQHPLSGQPHRPLPSAHMPQRQPQTGRQHDLPLPQPERLRCQLPAAPSYRPPSILLLLFPLQPSPQARPRRPSSSMGTRNSSSYDVRQISRPLRLTPARLPQHCRPPPAPQLLHNGFRQLPVQALLTGSPPPRRQCLRPRLQDLPPDALPPALSGSPCAPRPVRSSLPRRRPARSPSGGRTHPRAPRRQGPGAAVHRSPAASA